MVGSARTNKRDTEKMMEFAAELKDFVESGQGCDVDGAIKKAEQIEKLARGVQSKMKQPF